MKQNTMIFSLIAFFAITFSFLLPSETGAAGSISGVVLEPDGITPVPDLWVYAYDTEVVMNWNRIQTGPDGSYTIPDLDPGMFKLNVATAGTDYIKVYYDSVFERTMATEVEVTDGNDTPNINFTLTVGGKISGTITLADGGNVGELSSRPLIYARRYDSFTYYCDFVKPDGTYTISGIPAGSYSVDVDTYDTGYLKEFYNNTYKADDATPVEVTLSVTTIGIDFTLEPGGSLTGRAVDKDVSPVEGARVKYHNPGSELRKYDNTAADGSFSIIGIPPGLAILEIRPGVDSGVAVKTRKIWHDQGEDKDMGDVLLKDGALISGTIINSLGDPIGDLLYYRFGGLLFEEEKILESDGSLNFRLPVGEYTLAARPGIGYCYYQPPDVYYTYYTEYAYCMLPEQIDVTDAEQDITLPDRTAYKPSFIDDMIWDTVTESASHHGDISVMAFSREPVIIPGDSGSITPLWTCPPENTSGYYGLMVPPTMTVNVGLTLVSEDIPGLISLTVIDVKENFDGRGLDSSNHANFEYNSAGFTIQGVMTDSGQGIFDAFVNLYGLPGDKFAGVAETDNTGKYIFYNVRPGSYRIGAASYGFSRPGWSKSFEVIDEDVVVVGIEMDKAQYDFDGDGDVDGSDLAAYAAGYIDLDLDDFSKYFGHNFIF